MAISQPVTEESVLTQIYQIVDVKFRRLDLSIGYMAELSPYYDRLPHTLKRVNIENESYLMFSKRGVVQIGHMHAHNHVEKLPGKWIQATLEPVEVPKVYEDHVLIVSEMTSGFVPYTEHKENFAQDAQWRAEFTPWCGNFPGYDLKVINMLLWPAYKLEHFFNNQREFDQFHKTLIGTPENPMAYKNRAFRVSLEFVNNPNEAGK